MQAEILVIGALGNIGAEVVKALLARQVAVRASDLVPRKVTDRFGEDVEPVRFDFKKPETFAAAFQGIKKVFLLRPPQISDVKKLIFPAIRAAKEAGVGHIVFLSLIGIEQNKTVPHYKIEQYLRDSGMHFTFLRASFFMQNLSTTHRAEIRDRDEIYLPVGQAATSFVDARDIGAVAAVALTQPGHENQIYALTGSEALDYEQTAAIFSRILGRKITYKNPSAAAFFLHQLRLKYPLPYAVITTWLYTNTRSGMAGHITGDVQRLLGRDPITMRQFIEDHRAVWQR